jgi:hypothetical protein
MFTLDDLGVTTGAAEAMTTLHLADVYVVVEKDVILEDHLRIGQPLRMTSVLETDFIVHFRSRSRIIGIGDVLQDIG